MLSAEGLAAIRQRLEEATPGPWDTAWNERADGGSVWTICTDVEDVATVDFGQRYDAAFIAYAPTDIAALLATVEELRGLLEEARVYVDYMRIDYEEPADGAARVRRWPASTLRSGAQLSEPDVSS